MKNKLIIFGCGQFGHNALMFFGSENVLGFCDNDWLSAGTEKYGKPVISFEELRDKYRDEIVLIAVAGFGAYAVAEQCEENGVSDYLIYSFLRESFSDLGREKLLCFIGDPGNRMCIRKDMYYKRARDLKEQVQYFKRHADIRRMKPAVGKLRDRQQQCVKVSVSFFEKIKKLEIRPILEGGNLLGYVRHNGFIPWDDDIDFALIRKDYERLKEYCRQHMYSEREYRGKTTENENILPEMRRYYWVLRHDHFSIGAEVEDGSIVGMDFFPLEYYADHYSMAELRELADQMRAEVICKSTEEEKIQCVQETLEKNRENTAEESNSIYFGLDNSEIRHFYQREHFIPKNVIFPLKQILWEGEKFWVPNDAEKFLTYLYEYPWEFPEDVGVSLHYRMHGEEI